MNSEKCATIINMRSLTSVKEVQPLTGRLTSLSRFIPKAGEKSLSFFQCLMGNNHFLWTECEEAFQNLKKILASPSILVKSQVISHIYLYLCVVNKVVGTVITQEEGKEHKPIYFMIRILKGAEGRYQKLEKALLAIVITTRRLRYYFQIFQSIVKINLPVRQVLQK